MFENKQQRLFALYLQLWSNEEYKADYRAFGLLMLTAGLALTGYKNIVSAEQADDDQSTEK